MCTNSKISQDEGGEYHSGDVDFDHYLAPNERVEENIDQVEEVYIENQTAESLHMNTELQDSALSSGNFGSVEEDFDLLNLEEVEEDDQSHEVPTENRQLFISEQRLINFARLYRN